MFQLPKDCRVFCAIDEASYFTVDRIYMGQIVDILNILLWRESKAAKNKSSAPKSVLPDCIYRKAQDNRRKSRGEESLDIDDIKSLLSRERKAI